jgi:hypothetical protein
VNSRILEGCTTHCRFVWMDLNVLETGWNLGLARCSIALNSLPLITSVVAIDDLAQQLRTWRGRRRTELKE